MVYCAMLCVVRVIVCVVHLVRLFVRVVCGLLRWCTVCDLFACFLCVCACVCLGCYVFVCVFETCRVMLYGAFICGMYFVCVVHAGVFVCCVGCVA